MCWFTFAERQHSIEAFVQQSDRWLDGVWALSSEGWKKWYEPALNTFHNPTDDKRLCDLYKWHLEKEHPSWDDFLLIHHRKGSQWSLWIDNVHPYQWVKFTLCQNGTDKKMRDWWTVEWFKSHWSDSYCLLQYLEQHCKTLEECLVRLNILNDIDITLWTVVVTQWVEALIYCDWERDMYIHTDRTDGKIRFSSEYQTKKYTSVWYAFFNLNGTLHKEDWSQMSVLKSAIIPFNYQQPTIHNGIHHYDYLHTDREYDPIHNTYTYHDTKKKRQVMTNDMLWNLWKIVPDGGKVKLHFSSVPRPVVAQKVGNTLHSRDAVFVERFRSETIAVNDSTRFSQIQCMTITKATKNKMNNSSPPDYVDPKFIDDDDEDEIDERADEEEVLKSLMEIDKDNNILDLDTFINSFNEWENIDEIEVDDAFQTLQTMGFSLDEINNMTWEEMMLNLRKAKNRRVDNYYLNS